MFASWEDLLPKGSKSAVKIKEVIPTKVRASMDGTVPADITITRWYKKKGDKFAAKKLGRGRFRLWKEGKITLHQLIDQNGRSLSLAELRAL